MAKRGYYILLILLSISLFFIQSARAEHFNYNELKKQNNMKRPQEPQRPFPYSEEQVSFKSLNEDIILNGTLTLPEPEGLFPVVIMISGSGPQNRDEEIVGHKPFLVISDYLTRSGIAVLRFDDRGLGESLQEYFNNYTAEDFVNDVSGAVEFLKTQKTIDITNIGLLGHSEGANIASMVASRRNDISFIILFAGAGLTGEEIMLSQYKLIFEAQGMKQSKINKQISFFQSVFKIVKTQQDNNIAIKDIELAFESHISKINLFNKRKFKQLSSIYLSPWMRFFIIHNPSTDLRLVKCPVLALIGELDIQVPSKENIIAIKKALEEGGNPDFTALEIPNVNHLFQNAKTGNITDYRKIKETIAPEALDIIEKWISERVVK